MSAELVTSFPRYDVPLAPDDTAFERFYRQHHASLVGFAGRLFGAAEAEDIAQETMARAYVNFDRLDPERDPWPWLSVVARRVGMDVARSRSRTVVVDDNQLADMPSEDGETADRVLANDDRRTLRRALAQLSVSDRRVLRLREFDDLSSSDMAALLDCSETAVRQQLFRARRRLAERFRAIGALSTLPPVLLARAARRRAARMAGKLAASAGSVTAGGFAMSALVVVGGGAVISIAGTMPRAVDLTMSHATVQTDSFAGAPDRPAGYAVRPAAGKGHAVSAPAANNDVTQVSTGPAEVTIEHDASKDPTRDGVSHEYHVNVVVLGQRVLRVSSWNQDPNDYGFVCDTAITTCD